MPDPAGLIKATFSHTPLPLIPATTSTYNAGFNRAWRSGGQGSKGKRKRKNRKEAKVSGTCTEKCRAAGASFTQTLTRIIGQGSKGGEVEIIPALLPLLGWRGSRQEMLYL